MPVPQLEYSGFVNPYANSMADEIARSGDAAAHAAAIIGQAQARAAELKGAGWGRAIENLGQLPAQIAAQQSAQTDRKLKEQQLSMTIEERQQAQAQRVATTFGRIAGVSRTPEEFAANIDQAGALIPPEIAQHVKAQLQTAGQDPAQFRSLRQSYINFGDSFSAPIKLGKDETLGRVSSDPEQPFTPIATGASDPIKGAPGDQFFDRPTTPGGPMTPIATVPNRPIAVNGQIVQPDTGAPIGAPIPKQETPEEVALKQAQLREINAKLTGTIPMSEKDRAELKIQREHLQAQIDHWQNADDALDQAPMLTPEGRDLAAKNFAMTGQLPPMGNGKQGAAVRTTIINRAAELYEGLDLATQKAAYDANKSSLVKIQASADAVNAFEQTAVKNIDLFLDQAKKVPDTGIPLLNNPARWASGQVFGGADVSGYEAARRSAISEVAKVVSSPGLSGQLSDSARHEVESFIPQSATLGQAVRVMNVLKQEMKNRHQSYADQIAEIQRRIATPPGSHAATPHTVKMRAPNGQEQDVPADQVDHYKELGATVVH